MKLLINLCVYVMGTIAELQRIDVSNGTQNLWNTRRILNGREVHDTRPYMVYLRPAANADPKLAATNWICGGVIIHERYVLTSAACIEDVKNFYVISGTHRWIPATEKNDDCINHGGKKAVWKCVPKSYYYDGDDFDNISWMIYDIAVVKVEDNFNFEKRVRGCDFIPKMIGFNNQSVDLEKAGTFASIAGWGSTDQFGDVIARSTVNSPVLLEADVAVISTRNCKRRWDARYHHVIDGHMICTKDSTDDDAMSAACLDEVNCKELNYSDEEEDDDTRLRRVLDPAVMTVQGAEPDGRRTKKSSGGFCENDHGGPLVYGQGKSALVIGIMSAVMTRDVTHKCYGPFLFTSVFKNRILINCAINKDVGMEPTCRRLLKSTKTQMIETTFNWTRHFDGPAKSDTVRHADLQNEQEFILNNVSTTATSPSSKKTIRTTIKKK